jgi:hypothetical protein
LCTYLAQQAAQVLRVPIAELNTGEPLTYLGLDSLMALELRNRIVADLQVNLPVTLLLEGLSVSELQRQLMERLDATPAAGHEHQPLSPAALAVDTDQDAAVMLAQLDEMSEENVDMLLEKLLAEEGLS